MLPTSPSTNWQRNIPLGVILAVAREWITLENKELLEKSGSPREI